MKKDPLLVAFSTQKGGVGKSTFTTLAASYFHFIRGLNIGVIDCDAPQHSIHHMRLRDLERIRTEKFYKDLAVTQLRETGIKAYPIHFGSPERAMEAARELMEKVELEYDILFFDLPGTVNSTGVLKTVSQLDYIFVPIHADRMALESSLVFMSMVSDKIVGKPGMNLKGIYPFWNKYKASSKSKLYRIYDGILEDLKLQRLETMIPDSVKFTKELADDNQGIFRSTFFPPDKKLMRGTRLEELFEEIINVLKI